MADGHGTWQMGMRNIVFASAGIRATYHHLQLSSDSVSIDDPVDMLCTFEKQHHISVEWEIRLHRLKIHYNVYLERTVREGRARRRQSGRDGR